MKFCTVCEKEREVHTRVTKPKWWQCNKYKMLYDEELDNRLTYEREVCIKCQSELLIDKKPEFDLHIKKTKQEKEKIRRYKKTNNWGVS